MRKAFGFLLFFSFQIAFAQKVVISGDASFFKSEPIQVFNKTNALTSQKTLVAESYILEDGSYLLEFNLDAPSEVIVKIEMRELQLNLHPNTSIQIDFFPIRDPDNQRIPLNYSVNYSIIPLNTAADSIYKKIEIDFANYQLETAGKGNLRNHYDQYFSKMDSTYSLFMNHDTLFNIYYTYLKADAYLQTDISKNQLIKKYILDKPIYYSHTSYLKFLKFLMNTRINNLISKNSKIFEQVKKEYKIYESLMTFTKEDSLLGNDELRGLSILQYTHSSSSSHNFSSDLKYAIVNQISNFSTFPKQKEAALFYQSKSKHLKQNSEAPNFGLLDLNGGSISLNSLRGRPVYLGFINSNSGSCQRDLQVIETLKKKYRKVNFLMILTDRDTIDFSILPKESNNLTYLFLNNDYSVLEAYEIWNYPVYFLINAHGYFIQSPGNKPIDMFEYFAELFAKKSKRKSYEIIKE